MRKKILYLYFAVFPLMRGLSLRIRAVWSGHSFSADLVFTYASKTPFLMSQYLYRHRSRFTWNAVLLNIIKQNHCEIWRQAKRQIRKIFSYFSMNIYMYNVFNQASLRDTNNLCFHWEIIALFILSGVVEPYHKMLRSRSVCASVLSAFDKCEQSVFLVAFTDEHAYQ